MKEYDNLQALLDDQKREKASETRGFMRPLRNEPTVEEFMELMRRHGLEDDVRHLDDLLSSLDGVEKEFSDMRDKIISLQSEVDQLNGNTPLTEQFKKEMNARSVNMWLRMEDLSQRFLDTKDAIISACKEGLANFIEKGHSALHKACAAIYTAGISFYEQKLETDKNFKSYSAEVIDRVDQLNDTFQAARHQRKNLFRVMANREPQAGLDSRDDPALMVIRKLSEIDLNMAQKRIDKTELMLADMKEDLAYHKEMASRKPSIVDKLKGAKDRSSQQKQASQTQQRSQRSPTIE